MAEGVLGLGSGAASLNNELIEKLKEAERASTVAPIETDIENISGEGGESEKIAEIIAKANELLETIKPFDLFVSGGQTAFDNKTANTTGTSVVFDAVDAGSINEGTTKVHIEQLAQKDVFQTNTFSDATVQVADGNDSGDMISLAQAGRPVYQSDITITADTVVDASGGTITIDGTTSFTVTATMTYSELADLIDADENFDAKITTSGRLSINNSDEATALTIVESLNTNTIGGLDAAGEKYTTEGKTYEELAASINANSNYTATIETVGTDLNRLVIKSVESGTDNAITITQTGLDLGLNQYESSATVTASSTISGVNTLTLDGTDFDTIDGETYSDFIGRIDADANYNASIDSDGKVFISNSDGSDVVVTTDDLSFGFDNSDVNHTVTAQNLKAEVDGIDYNVSSNILIVDGGLKITAVEVNDANEYSTIAVNKDTTTIEPALQLFVSSYNELVALVDEELYSSESNIEDKATLRSMMSDIKDKMFGSYGTNDDLNIFNFGFEIDKSGILSLDSATFNEATESDIESLKSLFVGVAEDRGLGTQLKDYVDALDGFEGLLSSYETNMNTRLESLEEEQEKAIETLDNKYELLSAQFASYNAIINQFESQFSGLKLMIEQSVASG